MKKAIIWIAAVLLTVSASIYQRKTGPTYPLDFSKELNSEEYQFELTRSADVDKGCEVSVPVSLSIDEVILKYRKYPGDFDYEIHSMIRNDSAYVASLPIQPPAGKLMYYLEFYKDGHLLFDTYEEPAIVRFKGSVPAWALIPHIIGMFLAMLFSTATVLMVLLRVGNMKRWTIITFLVLCFGGFVFGPIVQYYAFGKAWTGFPVGMDLTDNKTLIAGLFWLLALIVNLRKEARSLIVLAGFVLIVIFSIPHSMRGSEYNYETESVETGE